ncbi:MAG: isopentenyl-diphosphate Delta-isomerase, partial [Bacteroidota bacterium]|nr:isopentenyl-diphosphate Delta-isomerase [Bacteroidota bacterium]
MAHISGEEEQVVLVNEQDEEIGTMPKLEAHQKGVLHRAFSIFIFNDDGELLLQRRAKDKYHSAGLWSNTCCSHPRSGEALEIAAVRRLREEMGMEVPLQHRTSFIYHAEFENGLKEHELDHIFFGRSMKDPNPDPAEVADWKYVNAEQL